MSFLYKKQNDSVPVLEQHQVDNIHFAGGLCQLSQKNDFPSPFSQLQQTGYGKGEESFHMHKQSRGVSAGAAQPQGITKPHWAAFSESNEKQGQGSGYGGLSNVEYCRLPKISCRCQRPVLKKNAEI